MKSRHAKVLLALVLAMLVAMPTPCQAQNASRPVKDKWALIIGVSKFEDGAPSLQYAAKDAEDFSKYLINEAHFAPDHVHVLLNEDASRENILSELGDKWLPHVVEPDDLALIFISSHGSPSSMDVEGINYVVAYNTDPERLYATGISMQELASTIKERVHSDRVVIILDACHSGSARTSKGLSRVHNFSADSLSQGTGQLVICSSAPSQESWESKEYSNGVFTHHLIASLKSKPRFDDAFTALHDGVQTEVLRDRGVLQTPIEKSKWTGTSLMLTAMPTHPRPGLPQEPLYHTPAKPQTTVRVNVATPVAQSAPVVRASAPATRPVAIASASVPTRSVPIASASIPFRPATTVSTAPAEWGQSLSNGFMRLKVIDVEQRMTGFFIQMELENLAGPADFDPSSISFECFAKGYFAEKLTGSNIHAGYASPLRVRQKTIVEFSTVEPSDEVLVSFKKIGWQPMKFRLTTEGTAVSTASDSAQSGLSTTASLGNYASNGFVRMKVLDTEQKMTGFFIYLELVNDTQSSIEPYGIKYSFSKDGYANGSTGGSGVYGAETLAPGRREKLTMSNPSEVDTIEIKFPKPNWPGLTLQLR